MIRDSRIGRTSQCVKCKTKYLTMYKEKNLICPKCKDKLEEIQKDFDDYFKVIKEHNK